MCNPEKTLTIAEQIAYQDGFYFAIYIVMKSIRKAKLERAPLFNQKIDEVVEEIEEEIRAIKNDW